LLQFGFPGKAELSLPRVALSLGQNAARHARGRRYGRDHEIDDLNTAAVQSASGFRSLRTSISIKKEAKYSPIPLPRASSL
jgi:hypothetical protein